MGTQRVHLGHKVHEYLIGNADRPIPISELVEATGWGANSIPTCISRLMERYPGRVSRPSKGVYQWNSTVSGAPAEEPAEPDEMIVQILSRNGDKVLVRDEETKNLFVLTPFEF